MINHSQAVPKTPLIAVLRTKADVQALIRQWKGEGASVGFVPTMGALHAGHLSLVTQALQQSDRVIASIFVNPTQFSANEDLDTYPRQNEVDISLLETVGTHAVYIPDVREIYPDNTESAIKAGAPAQGLETLFRPHFFDGVVNVVQRLFDHVTPDVAIFGEKDFQQLQVIRDMTERLELPIKIIGAPTIRDENGLALSSRNAYLSPQDIKIANQLNLILFKTKEEIKALPSSAPQSAQDDILNNASAMLCEAGFDTVDYVSHRWGRLLAAAWLGKTRLIDNVEI